jgi:hypothetical protein
VHTFGVSGKLIMNALVMYDHQTDTLWSQFLGKGVLGELAGADLDLVPLTQTTWAAWKLVYPDTLALDKMGRYQFGRYYTGYYLGSDIGVTGETNYDTRLHSKALVVGVAIDGHTKAYPLSELAEQPVVNDAVGGKEIIIFLERGTDTALVYDRQVDGRPLTFEIQQEKAGTQALVRDLEADTTWMALTGVATDRPLKGTVLARIPSPLSFWFAWNDWNPETELFLTEGN